MIQHRTITALFFIKFGLTEYSVVSQWEMCVCMCVWNYRTCCRISGSSWQLLKQHGKTMACHSGSLFHLCLFYRSWLYTIYFYCSCTSI